MGDTLAILIFRGGTAVRLAFVVDKELEWVVDGVILAWEDDGAGHGVPIIDEVEEEGVKAGEVTPTPRGIG